MRRVAPLNTIVKTLSPLSRSIKKKRGRGRPKKAFLLKHLDNFVQLRSKLRGRGRPKKITTTISHLPLLHVLLTLLPKRGRGRPKKRNPRKAIEKASAPAVYLAYPYFTVWRYYFWQTGLVVSVALVLVLGNYYLSEMIFRGLPVATALTAQDPSVTTRILDRKGNILYRVYADENRTIVNLEDIPKHVIHATLAIEDKDFYNHHGFSVTGIARAARANLKGEYIQGGSTITQQLVKLRLLSSERTITRKIKELILAVLVENNYTKDEILEMYLNTVAYGGSTYGIEEASQRYFGKPVADLSVAESALLAGLPQSPSVYTPFGNNPELAYGRQREVLRRMVEDGYLTAEEAQQASQEPLAFRKDTIDITAPHFVMYVKQLLAEKYGEEILTSGGLIVKTTLDTELQQETQKKVTDEVTSLKRLRITNGAALITNPQTGEILSMVGSTDYFNFAEDGQVNVVLRERQPGSSIKPLTYAIALERGWTPITIIEDTPVTYAVQGSPPYSPKNYDGQFHGRVTLKESLASSYNIPAVKTLNAIGIDTLIDKAERMGITTWENRKRYGLSLTLGGGEVRMIDMAQVYGAFANGGYKVEPNPILEITTYKGEVLYRNECALDRKNCLNEQVLDSGVAYLISNILSDNGARTPAFGPMSALTIPNQEVAVKTGTTNNLRDNWTIGYSSDRLVAVWVGNNDNTPMSYVASGITGASPIWNKLMRLLLNENEPHHFAQPPNVVKTAVCLNSGTLACSGCPRVSEEYFVRTTQPTVACGALAHPPSLPEISTNQPAPTRDQNQRGNNRDNRRPAPAIRL